MINRNNWNLGVSLGHFNKRLVDNSWIHYACIHLIGDAAARDCRSNHWRPCLPARINNTP
ncbi:hypothetical protein QJS10_CPA08g00763 [Acorus calamus]|uniref:Uncharacterized protein n=1 Tax=Acorus calamus TaxID=4465 RepID=A0AAV9EC39_ACOCL|nr:hypothetical protein QJS10_CPA08g00763 [Acorus calamus]